MRGVWLEDRTLSVRDDLPLPEAGGEAVVEVLRAGICNTDLELVRGYYPFAGVPGHEFVGRVVEAPAPEWLGKRVVGEINAVCGACRACRTARRSHCERRTVLGIVQRHGAFAERLRLPVGNLHEVPRSITDEEAVFVEPLAAALEVAEQVRVTSADRVLVIGDGKLGQLVAQTLQHKGCDLHVVGRHRRKRQLLESRGIRTGAPETIRAGEAEIVVECTGNPAGFDLARKAVRPRGTIVLKSTYAGDTRVNFSSLVVDEITLVGSRCGPFAPALDLLARHAVDVRPLIDASYPLSDALTAFEHAARPGVMKVQLTR
jgi:threonine dehydrogenase-like Zn-dependent dehydrogenase